MYELISWIIICSMIIVLFTGFMAVVSHPFDDKDGYNTKVPEDITEFYDTYHD